MINTPRAYPEVNTFELLKNLGTCGGKTGSGTKVAIPLVVRDGIWPVRLPAVHVGCPEVQVAPDTVHVIVYVGVIVPEVGSLRGDQRDI